MNTLSYSMSQRLVALSYGITCHLIFAAAVVSMALALFSGMRIGIGPFRGWASLSANVALMASFPLFHSWCLSPKGRRFMSKLVPLGIGPKLSWTVFATISSLQLLSVFWLWSPSGEVWWEASKGWKIAIALAAGTSWVLLGKSMSDAQLGVQTGYVGWSSVFLNRKATYKPFATKGLYKYVRQPIYISFALLLWLTATWTPDQLVLALTWTGYCVVGAALKEKRFLRYFGDAFRKYQAQVPFWFPIFGKKAPPEAPSGRRADADVIIIGAGPVGLMLANQLGRRGRKVLIAEHRSKPVEGSMAIGITPPSLHLLKELELDQTFEKQGVPITTASVFEDGSFIGDVDFSRIPTEHRYILSLPQSETIELLKSNLKKYPSVLMLEGMEFVEHQQAADGVVVQLKNTETQGYTEFSAPYLIGCDGHASKVRQQAGIPFRGRFYRSRFFMADFEDQTTFGSEAHLYFGSRGSVESFPLPGNKRRWIIQMPLKKHEKNPDLGNHVIRQVQLRTGIDLSTSRLRFESSFRPQRRLATRYFRNRVILCGDAAHLMSPIGGQGMNTGFADAAHLAATLHSSLDAPEKSVALIALYNKERRESFNYAATRAARGMWMGTRTGLLFSALRRLFAQRILFHPSICGQLAPYFAMLTIPGSPLTNPEGTAR
ncbi:FAD-dependent monooxygenase [Pontiellaceae bacterium B12219]|nr:FAD-dependent monooxygenase [Pontiellaceae bacterium B12219]